MYAESTRPSAKREVQKERSAKCANVPAKRADFLNLKQMIYVVEKKKINKNW